MNLILSYPDQKMAGVDLILSYLDQEEGQVDLILSYLDQEEGQVDLILSYLDQGSGSVAGNPLDQPPSLDSPTLPPGWVPFDTPAPAGQSHRVYKTTQRHTGTARAHRHTGVVHSPHTHTLAGHHAVTHPHKTKVAHHKAPKPAHEVAVNHLAKSHARLSIRLGLQRVELGVITSLDLVGNTAMVRLYGSQTNVVGPIPLGLGLAGAAAVGTSALVVLLDDANPADGMVVGLYNGQLPPYIQRGSLSFSMTTYQQTGTVTLGAPFPNALDEVVATSENAGYVASVGAKSASGFTVALARRDGGVLVQSGYITVSVPSGAGSAVGTITFPTAFGAAGALVATTQLDDWTVTLLSLANGTATVTVRGVNSAVGPATVSVYWVAVGVPVIGDTVVVDWIAVGR